MNIASRTRSAKPELLEGLQTVIKKELKKDKSSNIWITPSKLTNYIKKDPFADIALHYVKSNNSSSIYATQGCKFEDNIYDLIEKRFPGDTIKFDKYDDYQGVISAIKSNIPFIFQAPLKDDERKIRGIADILVKGKYLSSIFKGFRDEIEYPDNYYVIDIKFKTLYIKKDGELSNQLDFKTYKVQTCLYNQMLEKIQRVYPRYSYIMGRGIKGECMDPFYLPGRIDTTCDDLYNLIENAISHYIHIQNNWQNYDIYNLPIEYLPNTAVVSWSPEVQKLKYEVIKHDITKLPYCGVKHREYISNMNWNDTNLNIKDLRFKEKMSSYLQRMIDINKRDDKLFDSLIEECKLELDNALFLDFETIPNIVETDPLKQDTTITDFVFMIGFTHNNEFTCYKAKEYSLEDERKVFKRFLRYCRRNEFDKIVFYYADKQFFDRMVERHSQFIKEKYHKDIRDISLKWFDLHRYLKDNEFVVKNLFNLKLKNVVKALGLPNFEEKLKSGEEAFILALRHYTEKRDKDVMKSIVEYNELDCHSLFNIYNFLKTNLPTRPS